MSGCCSPTVWQNLAVGGHRNGGRWTFPLAALLGALVRSWLCPCSSASSPANRAQKSLQRRRSTPGTVAPRVRMPESTASEGTEGTTVPANGDAASTGTTVAR